MPDTTNETLELQQTEPPSKDDQSKRFKSFWKFFTATVVGILLVVVGSFYYIQSFDKYMLADPVGDSTADVGIVFGSGVAPNGKPFDELQARLDDAAEQLERGFVSKLILSGDNRFESYNEPTAMLNYLLELGISEDKLQPDFAGRSTYETCERAKKIFGVNKAILFSANSHLPRAIFTCRAFGVESYGIGNTAEGNNASRREPLARVKALFNIYIYGEETILGDQIKL